MWRNFGALMGAVSKITGPRVIQPGSVITRRTRDPRVPPVVFNFSVCSCTYLCMCACVCAYVYAREHVQTWTESNRVLHGFPRDLQERHEAETDFSMFLHQVAERRSFFHQKDREPIDNSSFFPPLIVVPIKRFLVLSFFFSELNAENSESWKFRKFSRGLILWRVLKKWNHVFNGIFKYFD